MQPHVTAALAGLAVGAFLGYKYAGKLQTYQPYKFLFNYTRGGTLVTNTSQTSLAQSVQTIGAGISGFTNQVTDSLSALQALFGSNSASHSDDVLDPNGDGNNGGE